MTCSMVLSGKDSVQLQGTLTEFLGRVGTTAECSQGYGNDMIKGNFRKRGGGEEPIKETDKA